MFNLMGRADLPQSAISIIIIATSKIKVKYYQKENKPNVKSRACFQTLIL